MSLQPQAQQPETGPEVCPLCGTLIAPHDARCHACNADLAGVGERPGPFRPNAAWVAVATLVALYGVVVVIVALAR